MNTNILNALQATVPSGNVSDKYRFISSGEFVKDVEASGFKLISAQGAKRGTGLGKHKLEFTMPGIPRVHGCEPRLVVVNAHDGSSSFRLMLGFFRFVCSNGLVVGKSISTERIVHVGYAREYVAQALENTIKKFPQTAEIVVKLANTQVTPEAMANFLNAVKELRPTAMPVDVTQLVRIARKEDCEMDAFTIFNRVQENLIQGQYQTSTVTKRGIEQRKARAISAVSENLRINRAIWDAAEAHLLPKAA